MKAIGIDVGTTSVCGVVADISPEKVAKSKTVDSPSIFKRLRKLGKIQPEHWHGDYKLNNHEMYLNIPKEDTLDCFEFGKAPDTKLTPKIEYEKRALSLKMLSERMIRSVL